MYNTKKYTAFLSSDEIIECDAFRPVWEYARLTVRNYDGAAIIFRNSDNSPVCALSFDSSNMHIFRGASEIEKQIALLKEVFTSNERASFCWHSMMERA